MTKNKLEEKIVCDTLGCGGLSTYRLTFSNKTNIFLCEKCYQEMKEFFKNDESKAKRK